MERIYLDNNATTIVDPLVKDAMEPFACRMYGNPNSLHSFGTEVHPLMRLAYDRLYNGIGADDEDDIVLNGCTTEGNNTVLKGIYFQRLKNNPGIHIITSQVEHPSITQPLEFLETLGVEITYLPVNSDGIIDADTLAKHIDPEKTALVSIMWANNETGLINPVKDLAAVSHERGVPFHTDGTQAIGKVHVNVRDAGIDFMTFSAHKFHGPKGVGGLYIKAGLKLPPLFHGGEQMADKRAGTINVAGLVGMGLAMKLAVDNLEYEQDTVRRLRDRLEDGLLSLPGTQVIGRRDLRTPNTILVSHEGVEGEAMIWDLNRNGISASTGSACASESLEPNPTFIAIGIDKELAHTGIRLSLSRFTTEEDIDRAIDVIGHAVTRLRNISSNRSSTGSAG